MKVKIFVVALLLINILNFKTYCQERFKVIDIKDDISLSIVPRDGIQTIDKGYLITCGACKEIKEEYIEYGHISKYNVNGKLLWFKRFDEFCPEKSVELPDGSIIIAGLMPGGGIGSFQNLYLVKLNSCGEVEWAKHDKAEYHKWDLLFLRTMIDVGDGVILPLNSTEEIINDDGSFKYIDNINILKLDYSGNMLFHSYFKYYGRTHENWYGVVDSKGNIWMSGRCYAPNPKDTTVWMLSPVVWACDSLGNLLYAKSGKDSGLDMFGNNFYNRSIIDDKDNFYSYLTDSFVPINGKEDSICSGFIKVDKNRNLSTHKFCNYDVQLPDDRRSLNGLSFINGYENLVTVMNYIHDDNLIEDNTLKKKKFREFTRSHDITSGDLKEFYRERLINTGKEYNTTKVDEDFLKMLRNRMYILDINANVVDSADLDKDFALGERTYHIFPCENNEIVVLTANRSKYDYTTHIRKYNNKMEPAFIDTTEREYDIYCNHKIESGLVKTKYTKLEYTSSIGKPFETKTELKLSPNPAQGNVRIYLSFGEAEKQVEFYDTMGRLCKTVTISDGWAQENIDISDLKSGIYIVKLKTDKGLTATEKLIVK